MQLRHPSSTLFPYTTLFRSNQQLSEDRADNVTNILVQQGRVPLTRMLAPAAMGESHQIETADKETEQAENRRVVVRVLRSEEHTSELQSHSDLVCRLLLEKK